MAAPGKIIHKTHGKAQERMIGNRGRSEPPRKETPAERMERITGQGKAKPKPKRSAYRALKDAFYRAYLQGKQS